MQSLPKKDRTPTTPETTKSWKSEGDNYCLSV